MDAREMARRTPDTRDRTVDFLRAFSIGTVVLGHWIIAVVTWHDERVGVVSAIGLTSGLWLATWVLQVMPLFFFVGGFSNAVTIESVRRDGDGYAAFLRRRLRRLFAPTLVFLAVWGVAQAVFALAGYGGGRWIRFSFLPFGPLWFLFVFAFVTALAPAMLRLHRRLHALVPLALIVAVVAVDLLRFGAGVAYVEWLNLPVVWLFAHQLGFFHADGTLTAAPRRALAAMAAAGLGSLVALTNIGVYPRSMIGTDVERVSNMNPPTVCIVALTIWLVALAMLLRPALSRWLQRTRPWTLVVAANGMIMTLFLWHLTAYLVAIVALRPLGFADQPDTTARWWLERPVFVAVPAVVLAALVAVFSRFERAGALPAPRRRASNREVT